MSSQPSADPRVAAWRLLLESYDAVVDVLAEELEREHGLPLTWYDVLVQLSEADGRTMRMHQLADAVLISRSGLTRVVDRMEAAALVERRPSADDRRAVDIALTPRGRAALRRAWPVHRRGIEEHFGRHLSDGEARAVASALRKVVEAARAARRPPAG